MSMLMEITDADYDDDDDDASVPTPLVFTVVNADSGESIGEARFPARELKKMVDNEVDVEDVLLPVVGGGGAVIEVSVYGQDAANSLLYEDDGSGSDGHDDVDDDDMF